MLKEGSFNIDEETTRSTNVIIYEKLIFYDWNDSCIKVFCKEKDDAIERRNYRGLKKLNQILKVIISVSFLSFCCFLWVW